MTVVAHIVVFLVVAGIFAITGGTMLYADRANVRRRQKYEAERARQQEEFARHLTLLREREALEAAVTNQRRDHSVVSVPVTRCDRQERRRIIKLED